MVPAWPPVFSLTACDRALLHSARFRPIMSSFRAIHRTLQDLVGGLETGSSPAAAALTAAGTQQLHEDVIESGSLDRELEDLTDGDRAALSR